MMRRLVMPLCLLLGACAPAAQQPEAASRAATGGGSLPALPAMKHFATPHPVAPSVSNTDLARDILDLSFTLESGRALPVFTRFEGPVTLRVTGNAPATLRPDLDALLGRLRREAGIDITRVSGGSANITLEAIPRETIRKNLPQAACFVVPNVGSFREYLRKRHGTAASWTQVTVREQVTILLPSDAPPQELRDCLHEEIAQALGPLNDLYRLSDSVFNDDNVHTVLTGFDMTVLRASYDPSLRSGMTRREVAERLPGILARINPAGESLPDRPLPATPRAWIKAIQTALGPGSDPAARRAAARDALRIAVEQGWDDHRRGFSHYAMGRVLQVSDPMAAKAQFLLAERHFGDGPDTRLHQAYVASQLAGYALAEGRPEECIALVTPHLATATRHENAALLATLMLLRAEALELEGRNSESLAVRLDSLGWARYGFGSDWAVRTKLREIAALNPLKGS